MGDKEKACTAAEEEGKEGEEEKEGEEGEEGAEERGGMLRTVSSNECAVNEMAIATIWIQTIKCRHRRESRARSERASPLQTKCALIDRIRRRTAHPTLRRNRRRRGRKGQRERDADGSDKLLDALSLAAVFYMFRYNIKKMTSD